jgi:hypothetical protein
VGRYQGGSTVAGRYISLPELRASGIVRTLACAVSDRLNEKLCSVNIGGTEHRGALRKLIAWH